MPTVNSKTRQKIRVQVNPFIKASGCAPRRDCLPWLDGRRGVMDPRVLVVGLMALAVEAQLGAVLPSG